VDTYLEENGITGIEGIDTRALTLHIREKGALRGVILPEGDLLDMTDFRKPLPDPVKLVTTREIIYHGNPDGIKVALLDYGVKASILHHLISQGYYIAQFPAETEAEEILSFDPRGVLLSNGPGNPEDLTSAIDNIKIIMAKKLPMMGICLGHQLISLACGAKTIKLPFGHRGGNHPVKDLETGKIKITSQNHSYTVDESSLPSFLQITHINLNDNTIEGLKHLHLPVFSIQYHPEASPGPEDSVSIFKVFQSLLEEGHLCR
jgi:carbamoyl-phosphate synthase small subunit